ncbi:MAG: HAMP domain-containing protein, partial [Acidimicrobiia bacterium]|nr:HAMP domain-containing protein [Acidimicrobiia bacterium]
MRAVFAGLASILVGLVILEVTMQPQNSERFELVIIFGAMAALMAIVAIGLPRFTRTLRSIRWTFGILSVVSFGIVVVGLVAVAGRMFLNDHDLTLLLVVMGFGIVSAIGFAISVSKPLTDDLERLADVADHIAKGHVEAPVSIDRQDEVGRLARSIDDMVSRLDSAEHERQANVQARQAFFTSVGHDLRSPLASLRAAVEALQDGLA